jgi:hypothetical protein
VFAHTIARRQSQTGKRPHDSRAGELMRQARQPTVGNQARLRRMGCQDTGIATRAGGASTDALEQEADRVADRATTASGPVGSITGAPSRMSRKCAACQDGVTQGTNPSAMGAIPSVVNQTLREPGQPLDASSRAHFETRFGIDLGGVRVHPETRAATEAVDAKAFTVGQEIIFAPGQYSPQTQAGRWLLAHELTHVVQQAGSPNTAGPLQRKDAPAKTPTFRGCNHRTTLSDTADRDLMRMLTFARDLVDAAIGAVALHDESEPYRTALARHFINPSFDERKDLYHNLRRIFFHLTVDDTRCAESDEDIKTCEEDPNAGVEMAFEDEMKTVLCLPFWFSRLPCQAMFLIHEAAHAVGIGLGTPHPPYRGSADYPALAARAPASQTTAKRLDNPDAYAYFAAQIGRETDTECHGIPVSVGGVIEIHDLAGTRSPP